VTAAEAAAEDIGKSYKLLQDRRSQFGFRTDSFAQYAFSTSVPRYKPTTMDDTDGNAYLFWKTEEVASHVPKFDQVREKVLAAWKMIEARSVARKRAEELAAQARAAGKPLKELFASDQGLKVIETGSFSWMTRGNVPQDPSGGQVRTSQIEGLQYIGDDFMKTAFGLAPGQLAVASNHPQDTVYVVRLAEFDQPIDALRADFAKENPAMYMAVAQPRFTEMYLAWISELEREADVHWVRTPDERRPSREDDAAAD
jgi:hypothetical protein